MKRWAAAPFKQYVAKKSIEEVNSDFLNGDDNGQESYDYGATDSVWKELAFWPDNLLTGMLMTARYHVFGSPGGGVATLLRLRRHVLKSDEVGGVMNIWKQLRKIRALRQRALGLRRSSFLARGIYVHLPPELWVKRGMTNELPSALVFSKGAKPSRASRWGGSFVAVSNGPAVAAVRGPNPEDDEIFFDLTTGTVVRHASWVQGLSRSQIDL